MDNQCSINRNTPDQLTSNNNILIGLNLAVQIHWIIEFIFKNTLNHENYEKLNKPSLKWFDSIKFSYLHKENIINSGYEFEKDVLEQCAKKAGSLSLNLNLYENENEKEKYQLINKSVQLIKVTNQICKIFEKHINPLLLNLINSENIVNELLGRLDRKELITLDVDEHFNPEWNIEKLKNYFYSLNYNFLNGLSSSTIPVKEERFIKLQEEYTIQQIQNDSFFTCPDLTDLNESLNYLKEILNITFNKINQQLICNKESEKISQIESSLETLGKKKYSGLSRIDGTIKSVILLANDKIKYFKDMQEFEKNTKELEEENNKFFKDNKKIKFLKNKNEYINKIYITEENSPPYPVKIEKEIIKLVVYRLSTLVVTTFSEKEFNKVGHLFLKKSECIITLASKQNCLLNMRSLYEKDSARKVKPISSFQDLGIKTEIPFQELKEEIRLPELESNELIELLKEVKNNNNIIGKCKLIEKKIVSGFIPFIYEDGLVQYIRVKKYNDNKYKFNNKTLEMQENINKENDLKNLLNTHLLMNDDKIIKVTKRQMLDANNINNYFN